MQNVVDDAEYLKKAKKTEADFQNKIEKELNESNNRADIAKRQKESEDAYEAGLVANEKDQELAAAHRKALQVRVEKELADD